MKIRTGYSFRHAVGTVDAVMERLKALEYTTAPISDRASTFGFCRWKTAAMAAGLRPIFGVELGVSPDVMARKPIVDYWSFFARDDIAAVNELVSIATNQFRFQPLLTYEQAMSAGGVVAISGKQPRVDELRKGLTADRPLPYYPVGPSTSRGALKHALAAGMPLILSNDNRFPERGDQGLYETICGRNAAIQTYPQWILSLGELEENAKRILTPEQLAEALANFEIAQSQCQADLKIGKMLTPEKPKSLREMCIEGATEWGVDLANQVYSARLDHELKMIKEKAFEDYFYIIADAVQWARTRMLVGPARGSSCGSLVCYLLKITTVDPIPFGLIFERFIDVNRDDLPDVDVDFPDTKRELVFEYMHDKYGHDRIARLGSSSLYRSRAAINEASAAFKIPKWNSQRLIDGLIERPVGDPRAMTTIADTFEQTLDGKAFLAAHPEMKIAARIEGHPRHAGQHAAGIVVTDQPVNRYVAIDQRTGAAMCDKKDAEDLNLLKIDALGLTQLSILQDFLEATGKPLDFFNKVPLDDPAAFKVLNDGYFAGVFQFMGGALQSLAKNVKIDCLEDIISITALARPGPLASGGAHEWVRRKNGAAVTFPHPLFEPYLKTSLGIVIYQEQVMEIGRNIGGLSWGEVTGLRKAMSKSLGAEYFDKFGDKWKKGARDKGIADDILDKVWRDLCSYGSWSFNRSHSVAYGLISYYCAWAKAHHPHEFAAASLSHEADPGKKINLLRELNAEGIGYVPFSLEFSTDKWAVGTVEGVKKLVGPISGIVGVGPKLAKQFMSARARGEPLSGRLAKMTEGLKIKTDVDTIWPIRDRITEILPDPRDRHIYTLPMLISKIEPNGDEQEVVVFVRIDKIAPRDVNDLQNLAKRGFRLTGPSTKLNLRIADDSGEMLAMVGRYDYERIAKPILEQGGAESVYYALKGVIMKDFKMLVIKRAIFLGKD